MHPHGGVMWFRMYHILFLRYLKTNDPFNSFLSSFCTVRNFLLLLKLYNALDNRDQTIVELEKRLGEIIDSAKNETRETQLQTDLEQAKHEIIQQRQVISELEAQVGHNVAQNDNDAADLKNLRDQVEIKNKTIETQRRQLQQAAQKVDLVDTQNKSGKGEVYRLESENLR
jgi:hypothetical protein